MRNSGLWLWGGVAGAVSICCYFIAVSIRWPDNQLGITSSLIVASGFPIFGMVYTYALFEFVAAERDGAANRLGFIFAITAFTTLLSMLIVQTAVGSGIAEYTRNIDEQTAKALRRGLRLIDLGLDVAWDFLMSTSFIFTGLALCRRSRLGPGWGIPAIVFGVALIALNAATFPWPPGSHGLLDIGPAAGMFMLALAVRLAMLGRTARRADAPASAVTGMEECRIR